MTQEQNKARLQEAKQSKVVTSTAEKEMQIMKEDAMDMLEKSTAEQGTDGSAGTDGVEVSDDVLEKISKLFDTPAGDEQSVDAKAITEEQEPVDNLAPEKKSEEPKAAEDSGNADSTKEEQNEEKIIESEKQPEKLLVSDELEASATAPVLSNANLPVIQPSDKKAVLCVRGKYALVTMPLYRQENLVVEGCKFYLEDIEKGIPMIGACSEIKMDKSRLMTATDHGVMRAVNKFMVTFSDDDMKLAFERAKLFLENATAMVAVSMSMNITDAYREVVLYAIEKAAQEESGKVLDVDRKCKYIEKERIICIRDNYIKELLEEVGTGYTPVVFCKKLCMVEAHFEQKIIVHNSGRYACNDSGNKRFYKFYVNDELMGKGGAA